MCESALYVHLKEPGQRVDSLSNDTSLACCEVDEANECERVKNKSSTIDYYIIVVIFKDCTVIVSICRIVLSSPRLVGGQEVML